MDKYEDLANIWQWYPDKALDLLAPKEGGIKLHTDQRIFMRCGARFFSEYGCMPRGWGKTFCEVATMVIIAIRYPNIELGLTAQTKENAASLLKDKWNELVRYYPMLQNEVEKTSFIKGDALIVFKNGARIDALANAQSSKGQRRKRLNIEESNLMDNVTFEDALEPVVEVGRITTGKLAIINPEELNQQINFFTTPGFRGSDEYRRSIQMIRDMRDLKGKIVLGSDWMLGCWYGRGSSKSTILKKKMDSSPIAFDMNYGGNWVGSATGALVNINNLMKCRTLTEPILTTASEADEYYIGVDVARSQKKTNNQSSVAVGKVIRSSDGKIEEIQLANIIHISNMLNFSTQACIVKRVMKRYNAKVAIVDGNGLGTGLIDELMKETYDPKTGETYPAWNTINTTAEPETKNAETCLYDIKAQSAQTRIISNFIDIIDSCKLRFLENRNGGDYSIKNDDDLNSKVMPYVQEELFFQEVGNLKLIQNGKNLSIEKVVNKFDKDRFSAVAYLLYYIVKVKDSLNNESKFNAESYVQRLKKLNRKPNMY
jgi:ribonucleoside-diphosphate reductase alpha chain